MKDRVWDLFVYVMMKTFFPLVLAYSAITGSVFLNVSVKEASGFEWVGNTLLSPVHYLLSGKEAVKTFEGEWKFVQKHDYNDGLFWIKSTASVIALPPSLLLGSAFKALSLLEKEGRENYFSLVEAKESKEVHSHVELYRDLGLNISDSHELFQSLGLQRRPGDENALSVEKQALADIGKVLTEAGIPWWVDCGTCLGAYRYGGVIPWDEDADIAVLLPDFENVCHALNRLDPDKYVVQDWSSRNFPDSYVKVYIRESGTLLDIYHFAIDEKKKELRYILALENNMFAFEWWKIRERRFTVPVAFDTVFPLKKALLDGVEVFVPNNVKKYLQRYYGENLDPVKIYDPKTGFYEKDLSHPYWQRAYVH